MIRSHCIVLSSCVPGEWRVGIFASESIKAGAELTYDYNFRSFRADMVGGRSFQSWLSWQARCRSRLIHGDLCSYIGLPLRLQAVPGLYPRQVKG